MSSHFWRFYCNFQFSCSKLCQNVILAIFKSTLEFLINKNVRLFIFKKKSYLCVLIRDCAFICFDKEKFRQGKTLYLDASNANETVTFRKYCTHILPKIHLLILFCILRPLVFYSFHILLQACVLIPVCAFIWFSMIFLLVCLYGPVCLLRTQK